MHKLKLYLVVFLLLMPIIAFNMPVQASEGVEFQKNDDGIFKVRIESSQWEFKIYDIVRAEKDGISNLGALDTADREEYLVKHRVEMPTAVQGDKIEFHLYSRDVQHGFSINELDLAVALNRPSPGDEFGQVITEVVTLDAPELGDDDPESGVTYSAFCHIFCGLGHPDMKVKFVLGGGAFELGPYVFWGAVIVNLGIVGMTVRSILSKVQLIPKEEGSVAN